MGPAQRKARLAVIEDRRPPRLDRVAVLALLREARSRVVRVRRRREVLLVARRALRRGPRVVPPRVAPRAHHPGVPAGQREARRVLERRAAPRRRRDVVAVLAPPREASLHVARVRRRKVGRQVAVAALGRGVLVLVRVLPTVARRAVQPRVRHEQREPRPVVRLENLALVRPRRRRVARLAPRAELAAVRVLVAVRAGRAHMVENQRLVAPAARDPPVRRVERKARPPVTKSRRLVDRRPALRVVALPAVDLQVAVRVLARPLASKRQNGHEQERRGQSGDQQASHGRPPPAGRPLGPWQPRHVVGRGLCRTNRTPVAGLVNGRARFRSCTRRRLKQSARRALGSGSSPLMAGGRFASRLGIGTARNGTAQRRPAALLDRLDRTQPSSRVKC